MDNKDINDNKEENNSVPDNESQNKNIVVEDSDKLNELKKEIESQMGEVQDILAGNNENVLKFDEIPSVSTLNKNASETMVVHTNDVKDNKNNDDMSTAVIENINNNLDEDVHTEDVNNLNNEPPTFDGGKTELIQSVDVDRNFAPDSLTGENQARGPKPKKRKKAKDKKKLPKKVKVAILGVIVTIIVVLGIIIGSYVYKAGGDVKTAVLSMASDIVGEQDPIFILLLGVSEDIRTPLTDTIILCGYNPSTQKAYMLSIPRDTYVGKHPESANGYDKINSKFQTSAEKTVETVELITGVKVDYYVIVRNLKIADIFETIGSIDFDVPIDMNYDDPTQDLHIHLKKGYQTLEPDQIEQLLRFRHNNNGTSYPSSYGDNDYGRMKTQRNFIKAVIDQTISIKNVGKVKDLVAYAYTNIQTNMPGSKVLDYVPYGLQFSTSNLRSEQLPGQSAIINSLWFYNHSKSKTKKLVDELMIYLELDDETLRTHYKYGEALIGVKPDQDWVSDEVVEDIYIPPSVIKNVPDEKANPETCKHDFAIVDSRDGTCSTAGYIKYRCILCDTEKVDDVPASGKHVWNSGVITKPATYSSAGEMLYTCTVCGATKTETIPATNHTWGDETIVQNATSTSSGKKTRSGQGTGDAGDPNAGNSGSENQNETGEQGGTTDPGSGTGGSGEQNKTGGSGEPSGQGTGDAGNPNAGNSGSENQNETGEQGGTTDPGSGTSGSGEQNETGGTGDSGGQGTTPPPETQTTP
ncbi:MAG: LCP family protein [Clostridia bacterium]|nr:LCP family protein [Clostridia bacterium]